MDSKPQKPTSDGVTEAEKEIPSDSNQPRVFSEKVDDRLRLK